MSEKLTVQCPYCISRMVQVAECKDLVVVCPLCGASLKVSATAEDAVIRVKKSNNRHINGSEQ